MIVLAAKSSIPESVYEFESIIEKPSEEAGKPFPMTFATCKACRNLNEWKEDRTDDKKPPTISMKAIVRRVRIKNTRNLIPSHNECLPMAEVSDSEGISEKFWIVSDPTGCTRVFSSVWTAVESVLLNGCDGCSSMVPPPTCRATKALKIGKFIVSLHESRATNRVLKMFRELICESSFYHNPTPPSQAQPT